jgi:SAM-dependent methyltransferase
VWDFVLGDDYAASFGTEWSLFRHTQVDSRNGTTISRDQFLRVTGWSRAALEGRSVLDAGCGSGRYAEIAAALGAKVTALDLSAAAYVARENLPDEDRVTVVRGSVLEPPLADGAFDNAFSVGVLQHTPDPLGAARRLVRLVRPGGELAIWMYERRWFDPLRPKAWLRRAYRLVPEDALLPLCRALVGGFTPLARATALLPGAGLRRAVRAALPIASYWGVLPLDERRQREWSLLDTYDWVSPAYDLPQSWDDLRDALAAAGACDVRRRDVPGLTVTARRAA